jgi:hypothetical protein
MPESNQDTVLNRYPGVKPFSTSEDFLFFGRQSDIEALNTLIFIKQTVVLYGKSGYGKSSLINAGIIPKLKENESWSHFSIRFNNFSEKESGHNFSPSQTFRQRISENIVLKKDNVLDKLIPNEDSFWYWVKQLQSQQPNTNYIFFFDQFEELFTYPKEQIQNFSDELSELLYNTLPLKFKKKIAETDEQNLISNEEHEFLYDKPEVKVIFLIRSDRIALLNNLTDRHPAILQHSYELNALSAHDARQAIIRPASIPIEFGFATKSFSFTEKAIDKIIESIANPQDGKIEAATLQIVCRYVEDNLVLINKLSKIDENNLGDITDIFQQYYQGILNKLSITEKFKAQELIEDELIDGERRNPLSATYIKTKFGISDNLLSQLEQSSLLRKERDASGRILYEVSHDSLVAAIARVAEARRKNESLIKQTELEQQVFEERKRAEELETLNKKAVFRFRLAAVLTVVSILITAFAFHQSNLSYEHYLWGMEREKEANIQKEHAIKAKLEADSLKMVAQGNAAQIEKELNNILLGAKINASADKMNILYLGLENPITISVPGFKCSDIEPHLSKGKLIKKDDCKYLIDITNVGIKNNEEVLVTVMAKVNGTLKELDNAKEFVFRAKDIPEPKISFNGNYSNDFYITVDEFLKSDAPKPVLFNFDFDVKLKLEYFFFIWQEKIGQNSRQLYLSGDFTFEFKEDFEDRKTEIINNAVWQKSELITENPINGKIIRKPIEKTLVQIDGAKTVFEDKRTSFCPGLKFYIYRNITPSKN